jgi:hypothetical protein
MILKTSVELVMQRAFVPHPSDVDGYLPQKLLNPPRTRCSLVLRTDYHVRSESLLDSQYLNIQSRFVDAWLTSAAVISGPREEKLQQFKYYH